MSTNHFPGAAKPVRKPTAGQRAEDLVLVLILLAVGVAAGAGSFTHVHDWTMNNSPVGKADWFGWANAVISELVPVAALLVIRRRKRAGQPITYPAFLLILALALSVTAQLAVAKPGLSGGIVAVVPALAFAALAKLILGKDPEPEDSLPIVFQNAYVPTPMDNDVKDEPVGFRTFVPDDQPVTETASPTLAKPSTDAPLSAQLLDRAKKAVAEHLAEHGQPITRDELRAVLHVSNATTGDVMRALGLTDASRQLVAAGVAVSPLTGKPLL